MNSICKIFILVMLITSCSDNKMLKQIRTDFDSTNLDTTQLELDSILATIPEYTTLIEPLTIATVLYSSDHLLSAEISIENSSKETALLFGMYAADLAYARYNQRVQDCSNIIANMQVLAEMLAVPTDMFNQSISNAEAGIENPELVLQMADSIFVEASEFLEANAMYGLSAIMASGAYMESIRLICIIKPEHRQTNTNDEVYFKIIEVLNAFEGDEFIELLESELGKQHDACIAGTLDDFECRYY